MNNEMNHLPVCPGCESPLREGEVLVAGVCPRCKKNFEAAHAKNIDVVWRPQDLTIPKAHHHAEEGAEFEAPEAIAEGEVLHAYRESAQRAKDFYRRGLIYVKGHQNMPLAFDCWLLAMGMYEVLGVDNQVDLAKVHGCDKANISKVVKQLQARLGHGIEKIEPMPGQRTLEACRTFATVRNGQLKNSNAERGTGNAEV